MPGAPHFEHPFASYNTLDREQIVAEWANLKSFAGERTTHLTFRIADRGLIKPGYWADLVIFDPAKVQDNATYKEPHQYATGFKRVFVNGEAVIKDDKHTGEHAGSHPPRE